MQIGLVTVTKTVQLECVCGYQDGMNINKYWRGSIKDIHTMIQSHAKECTAYEGKQHGLLNL